MCRPVGACSPTEAQRRYANRESLCTVFWNGERPRGFIESGPGAASANFLNAASRIRLDYSFTAEGDRLFLGEVFMPTWNIEGKLVAYERWYFWPDGRIRIETKEPGESDMLVEETTGADLSSNWQDWPPFEELGCLLVEERDVPGGARGER